MNQIIYNLCDIYKYNESIIREFLKLIIQTKDFGKSRQEITQFSEQLYYILRLSEILKTNDNEKILIAGKICKKISNDYSIETIMKIDYN